MTKIVYAIDPDTGASTHVRVGDGEGTPGLSAYQVAVNNGFSGTEAEWLASLQGSDGSPGAQGEPGMQGEQGLPGADGAPGTTSWGGITDKPTTFTPSFHTHVISDTTGLQTAIDGKSDTSHNHDAAYEAINSNIQTHIASAHAPSDAQKNSDITKAEVEAKLTGEISSHTHPGGGAGTWTTIIKPADTARTNNTVSADPDMVVNLTALTNYVIKIRAWFIANATPDIRYALTFSGTATRVRRRIIRTATADVPAMITAGTSFNLAASPIVISTTGVSPYIEEYIVVQVGAVGGQLALQWAQVTTSALACTLLEGSHIEYAVT